MEQRTCPHVGGSSCFTSYTDSLSVAVPEETSERRERSPHTSRHRAIAQIVRPSDDFDASHRVGRSPGQPKNFHFHLAEAICLHNVQIHKGEFYGKVHVILGRNNVNGELWAIVSNKKTTLQTFAEYGLRFDIEANFLDDQAGGWNVQRSMIRDVCALSRLWFILSVATLYVSAQGVEVVRIGKRRWVDTHWFRGNSYFRIGWDWVKAALINGWNLLHCVTFSSNQDPSPAMASRSQYQKRADQLEFKVLTYSYNIS